MVGFTHLEIREVNAGRVWQPAWLDNLSKLRNCCVVVLACRVPVHGEPNQRA